MPTKRVVHDLANSSEDEQILKRDENIKEEPRRKRATLIKTRITTTVLEEEEEEETSDIGSKDSLNLSPQEEVEHEHEQRLHVIESDDEGSSENSDKEYYGQRISILTESEVDETEALSDSSEDGEEYDEGDELSGGFAEYRSDAEVTDDDERYARLLQQQEIALARSHFQDGFLGHELLAAVEDSETSLDMSYESLIQLEENLGEVKRRGLERRTISLLPKVQFSGETMRESKEDSLHSCVVCMTEYTEGDFLIRLPCEHYFHSHCASDWLLVKATCPICRKAVPESPIIIN